jgi:hypothetical protein
MSRTPGLAHAPAEHAKPLRTRRMHRPNRSVQRDEWRDDGAFWMVSKQSRLRRGSQQMKPARSRRQSREHDLDEPM